MRKAEKLSIEIWTDSGWGVDAPIGMAMFSRVNKAINILLDIPLTGNCSFGKQRYSLP
jgi:hypothetical protein